MVVKFWTRFGHVVMLGDSALPLLRLGGHSGAVPGAIVAADLPAFLRQLRSGLELHGHQPSPAPSPLSAPERGDRDGGSDGDGDREPPVSLRLRSVPLLDLVETAIARGSDLMWDRP